MPEIPDFDQIAWTLRGHSTAEIAEQLRQVWNARGAADIVKLEATFEEWQQPSMKTLDHALRSLDR